MSEQLTKADEGSGAAGLGEALARVIREAIKEELKAGTARGSMDDDDDLLTVEELAEKMKVSVDWVYDHASKLPFTRKLGPKMLRFRRKGLQKYLESNRY